MEPLRRAIMSRHKVPQLSTFRLSHFATIFSLKYIQVEFLMQLVRSYVYIYMYTYKSHVHILGRIVEAKWLKGSVLSRGIYT